MKAIQWRDAMSIDGGAIDEDHRFLIDLVNRFGATLAAGAELSVVLEALYDLKRYADTHFHREERLQEACGFPMAAGHKREHRRLTLKVEHFLARIMRADDAECRILAQEVADLLNVWLTDHIIGSDLLMKDYVVRIPKRDRSELAVHQS